MEEYFVIDNGEKIYYYIQRKKVKNLNLRVTKDKKIIMSIPKKMPIDRAKEFINKKIDWIKKQQKFYDTLEEKKENINFENGEKIYLLGKQYELKMVKDSKNDIVIFDKYMEIHIKDKYIENTEYIRKFYEKWLKEYGFNILENLVLKYCEILKKYNIKVPKVEIRKMKSRWGCCMPFRSKVVFNLYLIKTPLSCVEYVVLHELAHFKYKNHSKNFYNFIAMFMPDWKSRKKILNDEFMGVV